jgi:hypothetical protein
MKRLMTRWCPTCGHPLNACLDLATGRLLEEEPAEGGATLCGYCGSTAILTPGGTRLPTGDELSSLETQAEYVEARARIRAVLDRDTG